MKPHYKLVNGAPALLREMSKNPIKLATEQAGGQLKLATRLGITPQAVRKWGRAWDAGRVDAVPAHRAVQLESVVGMNRHVFRPDLWPAPSEVA